MRLMEADTPRSGEIHDGARRPAAETRSFQGRSAWLAQHILPHEPALRAWLQRRRVDGLDTDDIVNETYAVLAALDAVEDVASPRVYAFQTARSVMQRRLQGAGVIWTGDIDVGAAMVEPPPGPQASSSQAPRRLGELMAGLPPECREAFALRKIEGLSQREVAARMATTESDVEGLIARALRLLMSAMKTVQAPVADAGRNATPSDPPAEFPRIVDLGAGLAALASGKAASA
jgi:RNA polymerase sigma-70 factor (ECF subfamily)